MSVSAGEEKVNIGILDFRPLDDSKKGDLETEPHKIVASDLEFSGRFKVYYSSKPDPDLIKKYDLAAFIDGEYFIKKDKVTLNCYLNDAINFELIIGKKYQSSKNQLHSAVHRFSDEVVYRIFGEQGIAQSMIAYVVNSGNGKEIEISDFNGKYPRRLTNNGSLNLFPSWSHDKKALAYTSYRQGKPAIYITNIFSGETKLIYYKSALNCMPSWNWLEDKIAFVSSIGGNSDIYILNLDSLKNLKRLTFNEGMDVAPCWSPNGYEIAFTSDRVGGPNIFIMDNEGGNSRRITFSGNYHDSPAWSPKGDILAFSSMDKEGFNIYTINTDGSNLTQLTKNSGNNEHPSWSPDGRHIVFSSTRDGGSDLYVMEKNGTNVRRITKRGNVSLPEWSGF